MDRIHEVYFVERDASKTIHVVRDETAKNSNNISTRTCVALERGPELGKPVQKGKNKNRQSRNRNSTLPKFERELFY